ncbi:SDR family oxidoreductase [Gryllotalpicola sp.]|uniref:SDR family NAD(P)-dependent oxidoreductase n=1 Tax=Gryllotalpicola sp. TaxID=1932787 RepID=UPI002621F31C|nr:SDR family oxidoreductase [Gryllotalpicola sp.]
MTRALVVGANGALGTAIADRLEADGWTVDRGGRPDKAGIDVDITDPGWAAGTDHEYSGVVWAQGLNAKGGIREATDADFEALFDANVEVVARTLRELLAADRLVPKARGVVISSIWQVTARADKIAYVTSKAALGGLVPAIAADLAGTFAINGVLPGVTDTPMTRAQLSTEQLRRVQSETPGGALATAEDVASAVAWLLDPRAKGINGQWIAVDNGWSVTRRV